MELSPFNWHERGLGMPANFCVGQKSYESGFLLKGRSLTVPAGVP